MKTGLLTACILGLPLIGAPARGFEPPTAPPVIDGAITVNAEELIDLAQRLPNLIIIDSRIADNRKHGYIEGSRSLPDVDTNCAALAQTIPTLDAEVLFYCNGVRCGRSAKAAEIAVDCGYRHLYWFRGGFEKWKEEGYPFLRD